MSKHATKVRSALISVHECAAVMEVAAETVYELVRSGKWIGSKVVGRSYLIPRVAFEKWLAGEHIEQRTNTIPFLRRLPQSTQETPHADAHR